MVTAVHEVVQDRMRREAVVREVYLAAFLEGSTSYGRAFILEARGADETVVAVAETEVAGRHRSAQGEWDARDRTARVRARAFLDGYDAARKAFAECNSRGAWVSLVD